METIKIAFCNRPSYDKPLGGDAIQMLQTKKHLEESYNLKIDIVTDANDITSDYALVHVFNFLTYKVTAKFIKRAKQLNIPVVSSCIYWDYSYASACILYKILGYPSYLNYRHLRFIRSLLHAISFVSPKPTGISRIFRTHVCKFIKDSAIIAPNSKEEGDLLLKFAGITDNSKIRVIYNGVSIKNNNIIPEKTFFSMYQIPRNYILQVGRIEGLKNQLNLVYALKDNPEIPIVFIGEEFDKKYVNRLRSLSEARGNVFFLGKIPHEDIASFYRYAALHVLLSLRESPGLVSLEACSLQCPIVLSTSQFLPLKTYFEGAPYVADPLNIQNIKDTVLKAYRERSVYSIDLSRFSWDNVANQTFQVYKELLDK